MESTKPSRLLPFPERAHIFQGMSEEFEMDDLTPLQRRFAEEYLIDLKAGPAAIRAGSKANDPYVAGNEFLRNPKVAEYIAKLQADRAEKTGMTAAKLLQMLTDEAEADENDLYDENGNLLPVKEWPLVWRRGLVRGIETEGVSVTDPFSGEKVLKNRVAKIKLADRTRIKELIGRHVGVQAFRDNVALTGPKGGPVEVSVEMNAKEAAEVFKNMLEGK